MSDPVPANVRAALGRNGPFAFVFDYDNERYALQYCSELGGAWADAAEIWRRKHKRDNANYLIAACTSQLRYRERKPVVYWPHGVPDIHHSIQDIHRQLETPRCDWFVLINSPYTLPVVKTFLVDIARERT